MAERDDTYERERGEKREERGEKERWRGGEYVCVSERES